LTQGLGIWTPADPASRVPGVLRRQGYEILERFREEGESAKSILAFPERVLPRAADLWVQASLDQRQRFQQLFFPDGIAFDGNRFVRTGATAPAFLQLLAGNQNRK
jgi:hypothetical protein